jgi:hypothetical protein
VHRAKEQLMQPPTAPPPKDPHQIAADRLAARRARVHRIRVRATAGAVALFVAAFGGLYVQLSSGNDPALAKQATSTPAATSSTAASGTATTSKASVPAPSAVTTSQS